MDFDIAPATIMYPSRRSRRSARAVYRDGILHVAKDPRRPIVTAYDLRGPDGTAPEPKRIGRATILEVAGADGPDEQWRISTCGCSSGRWNDWTADDLVARSNTVEARKAAAGTVDG